MGGCQSIMSTSKSLLRYSHVHTFWQVPYPLSEISFANRYMKQCKQTPNTIRLDPSRPPFLSKESPTTLIIFGELTKQEVYATIMKEGLAAPPHTTEDFK